MLTNALFADIIFIVRENIGVWCNGNTWVSKTFVEGSSPSAPAISRFLRKSAVLLYLKRCMLMRTIHVKCPRCNSEYDVATERNLFFVWNAEQPLL